MADKRDIQNGLPYRPQLSQGTQSTYLKDVYKPLARGNIRLIEIHCLRDDGVLECKLVHKLLAVDRKPKYATISYTWNPKNRITYGKYDVASKHIILDGFRTRVPDKAATILRLMFAVRTYISDPTGHRLTLVAPPTPCLDRRDMHQPVRCRRESRPGPNDGRHLPFCE